MKSLGSPEGTRHAGYGKHHACEHADELVMRTESAPLGAVARAPRRTPAYHTCSRRCPMTRGRTADNGPGSDTVRGALRFGRWHVPLELAEIPLPRVTARLEFYRGIV